MLLRCGQKFSGGCLVTFSVHCTFKVNILLIVILIGISTCIYGRLLNRPEHETLFITS